MRCAEPSRPRGRDTPVRWSFALSRSFRAEGSDLGGSQGSRSSRSTPGVIPLEGTWRPRGCARPEPPRVRSTRRITGRHYVNSRVREEAVPLARDGPDESRIAPVVFEFEPQVSHVAVDDIAPGDVIGA